MRRLTLLASVVALAALAGCGGGSPPPRNPGITVAEEALRAGAPDMAVQAAGAILAHQPDDVPALLVQGDAFAQLNKRDEAASAFSHALRLQADSVRAKMGLGRLRLSTDTGEAITLFQGVLKQEPRNLTALTDLGIAYDLMGQHREAQDAYHRAQGIDSGNTPVRVNLALSLAMSGDSAEAVALIAPLATASAATPQLRHDYAVVLAMGGRETEAKKILTHDLSADQAQAVLDAIRQQRSGG
jgi:Flp pilus assembly protein TadD